MRLRWFQSWYRTVWQGAIDRLIDLARTERRETGFRSPIGADDTALLDSARRRWKRATDIDSFSMQALAAIVLDLVAMADARASRGLPVADLVETVGELGAALHPELSQRIKTALDGAEDDPCRRNASPLLWKRERDGRELQRSL